jgi:hypothetical protein
LHVALKDERLHEGLARGVDDELHAHEGRIVDAGLDVGARLHGGEARLGCREEVRAWLQAVEAEGPVVRRRGVGWRGADDGDDDVGQGADGLVDDDAAKDAGRRCGLESEVLRRVFVRACVVTAVACTSCQKQKGKDGNGPGSHGRTS